MVRRHLMFHVYYLCSPSLYTIKYRTERAFRVIFSGKPKVKIEYLREKSPRQEEMKFFFIFVFAFVFFHLASFIRPIQVVSTLANISL